MKKPAAKTRVVAKRHTHAKPAARGGHPAAGHAAKHHAAKKHHVAAKKHRGGTVKRGLALGEGVACCSAEALAASLRLAGRAVSDSQVLALHWLAGGSADTGAPVRVMLEAAAEFGLAGVRPVSFEPVDLDDPAAVILGLNLPDPHTVLADSDDWWSWGEPYDPADFPDAVIEEAWAVTWA